MAVADGGTATCPTPEKQQVKIRLNAIDAPERGQSFASRSKQTLSDMVFGREIEVEVFDTDRYGWTIAGLAVNGLDVNYEMVGRGVAWQYVKYTRARSLVLLRSLPGNQRKGSGLTLMRCLRGNGGNSMRKSGRKNARFHCR